jgi:prevent-host-death family protein
MGTVPQKELRNNIGEVLRRAEAGEEITITVSGRPVAQLGPTRTRQWVKGTELGELWSSQVDRALLGELDGLGGELRDPWGS